MVIIGDIWDGEWLEKEDFFGRFIYIFLIG